MRTRKQDDCALPVWEANMNAEQLAVIRHEGGPISCFAGAGSGKTRALTHRIARLVDHCGVASDRILAVTFSKKAADEMDLRVRDLGVPACCQTWHALCYRILREDQTPYASWTLDNKDRAKVHVKAAAGYKYENWQGADITKIRRFIGICKANIWEPGSPGAEGMAKTLFGPFAQKAVRVFAVSQDLIEDARLLTFDDMLVFAHRHLGVEENRQAWAGRFDYVMQDEAQDANTIQCAIAELLSRDHRNYMIVGDPGQSIYSFRGSTPEYLMDFPEVWSGSRVTMSRNYRSGRKIVGVANAIIREGANRLPEDMSGERDFDGKVEVVGADTLDDEARELASFVKAHQEGGGKLSDVTVLYRLNAQSRALEEALLRAKISYVIVGGTNFYERKEVKDLLAYLRLASGLDKDGDAIKRCINAPFRFLGSAFVEKLMDARAASPGSSLGDVLRATVQRAGIQRRQVQSASEWLEMVERVGWAIVQNDEQSRPNAVLDALVRRTRYIEWLEKEEGEESIESSHGANVRELLRVASAFATVPEFLVFVDQQVADSTRNARQGKTSECVTLMSIHRSKGLEWPIVWVVGCNETILPHAKGDPEEERRLMYVAATRARDHLVVSHVREMATRTGLKSVEASRYLEAFSDEADEFPAFESAFISPVPEQVRVAHVPEQVSVVSPERTPGSALPAWVTAPLKDGQEPVCFECERPLVVRDC